MPIPKITESGPSLSQQDIEKLETKLDARLPAAYRRFLLHHNGGRPEPNIFRSDVLCSFFGMLARDKTHDLLSNQRLMKQWLPGEVLAIADNEFGDRICLAIAGKNRGKVYFWDHEGPPADDPWLKFRHYFFADTPPEPANARKEWPGHPDLTLIADSFEEFLESFHEDDDEEPDDSAEGVEAASPAPGSPRKVRKVGGKKTTPGPRRVGGKKTGARKTRKRED